MGKKGSLMVFANAVTRTERDDKTGEDVELDIPHMKGYTVFNVERSKACRKSTMREPHPLLIPWLALITRRSFSPE
jgi:antirestriction protein ArdC